MARRLATGIAATVLVAMVTAGGTVTAREAPTVDTSPPSTAAAEPIDPFAFRQDMRKLWEDHITWTRLYIVSAAADLPDLDATAGRLLQNQTDIGNAVGSFYGSDAGAALTDLLDEHILIAVDLLSAAKAGDDAAVKENSDRWYANADQIADFLAAANPAWSADALRTMMHMHLDQTLAEATARLTRDWEADIAAYDAVHLHILDLADTLSAGIIEQFPDRFTA